LVIDKLKQLGYILIQINACVVLSPLLVNVDAKLKDFITTLTDQNSINEQVIKQIKYGEYFSHSIYNVFPSDI
jgi:hypothetical protein